IAGAAGGILLGCAANRWNDEEKRGECRGEHQSAAIHELLWKTKAIDRIARCDSDVLLAVDGEAHWRGGHIAARLIAPEVFAGLRVECNEVAFTRSAKQYTSGCRHHTIGQ